jgi:type IV secretory pathway TraG/TraD family ATPase VirD4
LGSFASVVGWKASDVGDGPGKALLLAGIVLAASCAVLFRTWWRRTPYDIRVRVRRDLSIRPKVGWHERPFVGWTEGYFHEPRFAMGRPEDSVGVIGPPRVNKTAGIAITQALLWGGPLISISQTPLMLRKTAARRGRFAQLHGGKVMVYAPMVTGRVEGLVPIGFSPASTRDPNEVTTRVESWIEAAATAKAVENSDHWRTGAGYILRGLLYAAAHHRVRPGDFSLVYDWLADGLSPDPDVKADALKEPVQILADLRTQDGDQWAKSLTMISGANEKERSSFLTATLATIKATVNPAVLRSTMRPEFDAEEFLLSGSSLFIVSPSEHQRAVAPLISMLVESIVHTAYRLWREGRLSERLLVSLDDLANVAPLPQLESIISQGGGQGVNVAWSLQSLAQLAAHYGREEAEAILSATRCKVIFGGLSDPASIERVSEAIPEERVVVQGEQETEEGQGDSVRLGRRRSLHVTYRRLLSPAQLREIPSAWSLFVYLNEPPRMLRQPLAHRCHQLRPHMAAWPELELATQSTPVEESVA